MKRNDILKNIATIRKNKGYSQEYVASKIGMKQAGYGLIENGERGLQYDLLLQIADFFEMDVIDIITYPNRYIDSGPLLSDVIAVEEEVTLQIKLKKEKKDKVLKMVLGEHNFEMLNKEIHIT